MHIVQDYQGFGPVWLTEGIADYVRYKFGVNNEASGWWLPDYNRNQRYDQGYGVTARFLLWLEKTKKTGIVAKLNEDLREHTFTDATWTTEFGKTLDELWEAYGQMSRVSGIIAVHRVFFSTRTRHGRTRTGRAGRVSGSYPCKAGPKNTIGTPVLVVPEVGFCPISGFKGWL